MSYCEQGDIELIFGATNVADWLDLDNDADATKKANRLAQWLLYIDDELDDLFRQCGYRGPPVGQQDSTIPDTVKRLAATGVGLALWAAYPKEPP